MAPRFPQLLHNRSPDARDRVELLNRAERAVLLAAFDDLPRGHAGDPRLGPCAGMSPERQPQALAQRSVEPRNHPVRMTTASRELPTCRNVRPKVSCGSEWSVREPAPVDAGEVRDGPSGAHRLLHVLGAVLVAVVLPTLLMGALVGPLGVSALLIGLILGVAGSKIGGTYRMLFVAPMLGVAAGFGAFTAYDWWWAALLASAGVIAGAGIGFGWSQRC